ncbi:MAG: hypothetical protein BECKG1743D_GA0114223_108211, partial [Candidatus Kentron sp. G]
MKKFLALSLSALLLGGCSVTQEPYTAQEFDELAQEDLRAFPEQEPFSREITLDEAMARAIKYNLKRQSELMSQELAYNQAVLSKFDLLPSLDIEGTSTHRSEQTVLDSEHADTGEPNDPDNINSERVVTSFEIRGTSSHDQAWVPDGAHGRS